MLEQVLPMVKCQLVEFRVFVRALKLNTWSFPLFIEMRTLRQEWQWHQHDQGTSYNDGRWKAQKFYDWRGIKKFSNMVLPHRNLNPAYRSYYRIIYRKHRKVSLQVLYAPNCSLITMLYLVQNGICSSTINELLDFLRILSDINK